MKSLGESMYSEKQLMAAIKSAFESGKSWGKTYQGWFSPSENDHAKRFKEAEREAVKAAQQTPIYWVKNDDGRKKE